MTSKTALLVVLALTAASSSANAQRTAGEHVDDSTLATSVKFVLIDDATIPANRINVESYKRTVQLSGFVSTSGEKDEAIKRARSVDGVDKVVDSMIVMPGKRSFGRTIDDQVIHASVELAISGVEGLDEALDVVSHVREGEVLLGGFVNNARIRDSIVKATRSVKDVKKVHDKLSLRN